MVFERPLRTEPLFAIDAFGDNGGLNDTPYMLSREGAGKRAIRILAAQLRALNRYSVAPTIITEPVFKVITRELKRVTRHSH